MSGNTRTRRRKNDAGNRQKQMLKAIGKIQNFEEFMYCLSALLHGGRNVGIERDKVDYVVDYVYGNNGEAEDDPKA